MIATIRPVDDNHFQLGTITLPVTLLSEPLRRRYDMICSAIQKGDNDLAGAIKTLSRDVQISLGSEILMRASHRESLHGAPGLEPQTK